MQRFFGIAVSAAMLFTSGMTAWAADHQHHADDIKITAGTDAEYKIKLTFPEGYKVNEKDTGDTHAYDPKFGAYQIFTGTVKELPTKEPDYNNPGTFEEGGKNSTAIPLTDIKWGNAFGIESTAHATSPFDATKTWTEIRQEKIVNFVLALAAPEKGDGGKYASAFANFGGFEDFKKEGYLADRFYNDKDENGTIESDEHDYSNVKFDKLATEVADVISDPNHNNREWLQAFTDILGGYGDKYECGNYVNRYYGGELKTTGDDPVKYESYEIMVPAGYYMILDQTDINEDVGGVDESYSARMLFVANDIEQEIKEDIPQLDKTILRDTETSGDAGHETEVAGVGDEVKFKLTGHLPSNYDYYTLGYKFVFKDTLSKGLTLQNVDAGDNVNVEVTAKGFWETDVSGSKIWNEMDVLKITPESIGEVPGESHVHLAIGTKPAYTAKIGADNSILTVTFPCLREIAITGTADNGKIGSTYRLGVNPAGGTVKASEIYVTYKAKVNENAIVNPATTSTEGAITAYNGNKNTATLEYSDNPQSYGDTDTTTPDEAHVYVFGLDIVKIDAAEFLRNGKDAAALNGAKFILVRPGTGSEYQIAKFIEVAATENTSDPFKGEKYFSIDTWEPLGTLDTTNGTTTTDDDTLEGLFKAFVAKGNVETNYELKTYSETGVKGHLNISGLNDGTTYTMVETATPEPSKDYAKIDPFTVTLTAFKSGTPEEYNGRLANAETDPKLAAGASFSFDHPVQITDTFDATSGDADGSAQMLVANFKYTDLPSTGGVGTVWFYILGAGGVGLAGVLFFLSKKKVTK